MLEKDIENLLARYPEEFFPTEGFNLIEQQHVIEGKRIDILFEDRQKRKIIVEVKRGILTREASGQVAEYFGLLKSKNQDTFYEMILCANIIPKERRLFLEHIGIECKELGISYLSEIAKNHSYSFLDDQKNELDKKVSDVGSLQCEAIVDDEEVSVWIFQANPQRYDILNALSDSELGNDIHWLVNQHKNKIKKGHLGLIWLSGNEAGIYAITRIESDPTMMFEYPQEIKYWSDTSEVVEALRVKMTIIKRLTNAPTLKKELKKISGLDKLSIFRQCQGTNFPVKNIEWKIISQLL